MVECGSVYEYDTPPSLVPGVRASNSLHASGAGGQPMTNFKLFASSQGIDELVKCLIDIGVK